MTSCMLTVNSVTWLQPPNMSCPFVVTGADDSAYVVKVYPWAVVCCLTQLALTTFYVGQLTGVWWGLAIYYLVLLLGFAGRFWGWRAKI